MFAAHQLTEQQKARLMQIAKDENIPINDETKIDQEKKEPIEKEPIEKEPIGKKPAEKRTRRTKIEIISYRRAREDMILKRDEYKKANIDFQKHKSIRNKSLDPEKQKAKKEKLSKSPYRVFVSNFSKENKGKHGKNYSKELSKAWKLHKKNT